MGGKSVRKQSSSRPAKGANKSQAVAGGAKISLGARLRRLRQERGLSIAKLAADVGITSGLISQVENGRTDPSLSTLRKIAKTLRVPTFYLLVNEPQVTMARSSADRLLLNTQDGGVQYEFISDPSDGQVEFTRVHVKPGYTSGDSMDAHPGRECALILQGKMRLQIEENYFDLGIMESITFDALRPHQWKSVGKDDLLFISVTSLPFLR